MGSTKHPSCWKRDKKTGQLHSFGVWICLDGKYVQQAAYNLETEQEARDIASRCPGEARVVRFTIWD
ncbi:hypothetical protein NS383_17340 [Pseudomonas oryzihabitans]|nr:hypothetical protein NS383_17340 [Pseudomonas psychrotolerans]